MKTTSRKPVFVLVGDSLTQCGAEVDTDGWASLLQAEYVRVVDVINRGLGGYTTRWVKQFAIDDVVEDIRYFQPALITLWLGTNDSVIPGAPQHVPLEEYRATLTEFIEAFKKAAPNAQILLISPPPVAEAPDHKNSDIREYAAAGEAIADALERVHVLNLNRFFTETYPDETERAGFFRDGIHFTAAGNHVVFEQLNAKLAEILPQELLTTVQSPDYVDLIALAQASN